MKKVVFAVFLITVAVLGFGQWKWNHMVSSTKGEIVQPVVEAEEKKEEKTFIQKLNSGEKVTIAFLGDSTTEQNDTTNGELNHVGLLTEWLNETYPDQINIINAGVSGNTIVQMKERMQNDVLSKQPDLVVISSGLNDASGTLKIDVSEFNEVYRSVVDEVLKSGASVILRTPNLTQNPYTNDDLKGYVDATRVIAEEYDLKLFDLYGIEDKDITEGEIEQSDLMKDTIHPNANGQQYIYENFRSFLETYLNSVE